MEHTTLAIRFVNNPDPDAIVPIQSDYRTTWWRPVLGPTVTALLDVVCAQRETNWTSNGQWVTHYIDELCTALGIGYQTNRRINKHLNRIATYNIGHFDIEPAHPDSPACLNIYDTLPIVPKHHTNRWPEHLQRHHTQAASLLTPQAAA